MKFEIRKTSVSFNFSFMLAVCLMLLFCDEAIVLMCLAASLLHEGGHLIFMLMFSQEILCVDFGAFGVRIEKGQGSIISYKKEALTALGGIMINFLLAFLSIMYYHLKGNNYAFAFFFVNIFLAAFNCLPVEVLDMGRALSCLLLISYDEAKVRHIADIISFVTVNLLLAFAVCFTVFIKLNFTLIFVSVYLYVITLFKKWS